MYWILQPTFKLTNLQLQALMQFNKFAYMHVSLKVYDGVRIKKRCPIMTAYSTRKILIRLLEYPKKLEQDLELADMFIVHFLK